MDKHDISAVGSRIRQQREFLGFTRDYVAERLSVSVNFCRDIEIGAKGMSIQTLIKLSSILKISTDYILLGKTLDADSEPLIEMLNSCAPDKRKFAENILKIFLLAIE